MTTHKDLELWKQSIQFVTDVYALTRDFPSEEKFGLISQIRRSAVSIPCNIAEGAARHSDKEFVHFLYVSLGSAAELETQLLISENMEFCVYTNSAFESQLQSIIRMLTGLIKTVSARIK